LSCTTNQRGIPFGYLHLLVQGHQCPVLCSLEYLQFLPGDDNSDSSGVFIAEEVHRTQDKGSGYKTTVDAEHSWRLRLYSEMEHMWSVKVQEGTKGFNPSPFPMET